MPSERKVVIVTGGNRGIGLAIVEGLWKAKGFHVIIACRRKQQGEEAAGRVRAGEGDGIIEVMQLDLCDFVSVRNMCKEFKATKLPLHMIITNAGILNWQGWVVSKDGFEEHLQANHLGHFLLVRELTPLLLLQARPRVISVGSELAQHASIQWSNMNDVEGFEAYMQSKLCNWLHMMELHARHGTKAPQMRTVCIDPGEANTDIVRHFPMGWAIKIFLSVMPAWITSQRTVEESADTAVWCATVDDKTMADLSGKFVRDRKLFNTAGKTHLSPFAQLFLAALVHQKHSTDSHGPEAARRLWELCDSFVDGKVRLPERAPKKKRSVAMAITMFVVIGLIHLLVFFLFRRFWA